MINPDEIQQRFPVSGPARLTLRNVDGLIELTPGQPGEISVRALKHPGPAASQTEIEITQAADGRVSVITHYPTDLLARLLHPRHPGPTRVDYTVQLPPACELDIAFVSGQAHLHGFSGEFALQSVSGPIHLEDLSGQMSLTTVSGSITAARLRLDRPLRLKTVAGAVVITDSSVPALTANTVSGPVRLDTELGAGPYEVHSVSGDVRLAVPAGSAGRVDLHSLTGRLRASLPSNRHWVSGGRTYVEFGAAASGPLLVFHSVSGDLYLATPDGEAAASAAADAALPAPSETAPDRLGLLDRVARGEITVDDAIHSLQT